MINNTLEYRMLTTKKRYRSPAFGLRQFTENKRQKTSSKSQDTPELKLTNELNRAHSSTLIDTLKSVPSFNTVHLSLVIDRLLGNRESVGQLSTIGLPSFNPNNDAELNSAVKIIVDLKRDTGFSELKKNLVDQLVERRLDKQQQRRLSTALTIDREYRTLLTELIPTQNNNAGMIVYAQLVNQLDVSPLKTIALLDKMESLDDYARVLVALSRNFDRCVFDAIVERLPNTGVSTNAALSVIQIIHSYLEIVQNEEIQIDNKLIDWFIAVLSQIQPVICRNSTRCDVTINDYPRYPRGLKDINELQYRFVKIIEYAILYFDNKDTTNQLDQLKDTYITQALNDTIHPAISFNFVLRLAGQYRDSQRKENRIVNKQVYTFFKRNHDKLIQYCDQKGLITLMRLASKLEFEKDDFQKIVREIDYETLPNNQKVDYLYYRLLYPRYSLKRHKKRIEKQLKQTELESLKAAATTIESKGRVNCIAAALKKPGVPNMSSVSRSYLEQNYIQTIQRALNGYQLQPNVNTGFTDIDLAVNCHGVKIAIMVDGPLHFLHKEDGTIKRVNAKTKLRNRLLEKNGWRVISLDYAKQTTVKDVVECIAKSK